MVGDETRKVKGVRQEAQKAQCTFTRALSETGCYNGFPGRGIKLYML